MCEPIRLNNTSNNITTSGYANLTQTAMDLSRKIVSLLLEYTKNVMVMTILLNLLPAATNECLKCYRLYKKFEHGQENNLCSVIIKSTRYILYLRTL